MSPGRRRSRISAIRATFSTPPICAMTRPPVPAISHALIARRSGSAPFLAITFSDMRTLTPMAMQVDEAGRHQLAAGIDRTQRPRGRDIGFDRFDHAIADADVAPAAQRLARIEHLAALDHEIELVVRPHGGECRSACGSEREGSGAGQNLAA